MISYAFAQTVTSVTPPTDWTALLWIVGIIAVIVAGLIYYEKVYKPAHPATTTTAPVVATLSADWSALVARVTALEGKLTGAPAPAPVPASTVPVSPAGKNGVAGTFSLAVTGNPATDLPAINSHYFS